MVEVTTISPSTQRLARIVSESQNKSHMLRLRIKAGHLPERQILCFTANDLASSTRPRKHVIYIYPVIFTNKQHININSLRLDVISVRIIINFLRFMGTSLFPKMFTKRVCVRVCLCVCVVLYTSLKNEALLK